MGIALRSGRFIERTDRQKQVAVVAASTVQRLWRGENPLGKRFSIGDPTRPPFEVIGVAPDVQTISLTQKAPATVYVPYWQQLSFTISLVAKTEQEPKSLAPSIRDAIRQIDPELPVPALQTMEGIVADSVAERRFQMNLVILFGAAAALALAAFGAASIPAQRLTRVDPAALRHE